MADQKPDTPAVETIRSVDETPAPAAGTKLAFAVEYVDRAGKTHKPDSTASFDASETSHLLHTGITHLTN